ncbi:MAG: relaxase/mobilization nuclease domain-containing protein [Bacteroidales bacterium]|nr:relaxase/mobilization nuclease domain-containing protein [Clostridium sp.]MCM1204957.1 relaxase/mobilization nuclease domain-containing protein [Bacteroidales bacterium]
MKDIGTITFHNGKSETKAGAGHRGYHTLQSLRDALDYIMHKNKTEPWLISTLNCNAATAYEEMVLCKEMYGKAKEDGRNRMLIHFSQNLAEGETNPETAHEIAGKLAQHPLFKGFQVVYATHVDTRKLHTHFVINSVSLEDGHHWQLSPKELQELKDYSDSILREYGLYIVPERDAENRAETYKHQLQVRMEQQGTSWKYETYLAVNACMEAAVSREEFIREMNRLGYQVEWSGTRKYVTFIDSDGHKLRNKKLYPQSRFSKEAMEKRFALNRQYREMQKEQEKEQLMDTAYGILRLANSIRKNSGTKYPMQKMEKDYTSAAARKEQAKEAQKGRGIDWENER